MWNNIPFKTAFSQLAGRGVSFTCSQKPGWGPGNFNHQMNDAMLQPFVHKAPERGIFMRGKRKRGDAGHRQHEVTCRRRVEQRASRIQRGMQQGGEDWEGDAG